MSDDVQCRRPVSGDGEYLNVEVWFFRLDLSLCTITALDTVCYFVHYPFATDGKIFHIQKSSVKLNNSVKHFFAVIFWFRVDSHKCEKFPFYLKI